MRFVCLSEFSQAAQVLQFRDALMAEVVQSRTPDGSFKVDLYLWLNKTTLDIIGDAGNIAFIHYCTSRGGHTNFTRF